MTLQHQRPHAIFLAGFMGSGKTTAGRAIAHRLKWNFVDLDDEIERRARQTISDIFDRDGEDGFRNQEYAALHEQVERAVAGTRLVLALGGGTYAYSRNRHLMRNVGPTLWLDVESNILWNRVRHQTHRPLAQDLNAFTLLHMSRQESYSKADDRIDGTGPPDQVVGRIFRLPWMQDLEADA